MARHGPATRDRRGVRGGLLGAGRPRQRLRPRHRAAPRRRRVHLRRGDGAAVLARGVPRSAAAAPAVPGRRGPLRVADGHQQRRDALQRPAHRQAAAPTGSRRSEPRRRPGRRCSRSPARSSGRATTSCRSARRSGSLLEEYAGGMLDGRRAEGVDAGRVLHAVPHRRAPRRGPRLRVDRGGRVAARHRRVHGAGRDRLHGRGGPAAGGVLRARVLREVHALPGGHVVGDARARTDRGRVRTREDMPLLAEVGENILFRAFCALADGAVSPISSTLQYFWTSTRRTSRAGPVPVRPGARGTPEVAAS